MEERRLDVLLWLEVGAMYVGRGATLQQTKHVIQKHHFLIAGKKEKCTTVEQVRASTTVMYKCLHVPELYVRRRDWFCAPQGRGCQAAPEEKTSMCQFNTPAARSGKKMNAWTRKPLWQFGPCCGLTSFAQPIQTESYCSAGISAWVTCAHMSHANYLRYKQWDRKDRRTLKRDTVDKMTVPCSVHLSTCCFIDELKQLYVTFHNYSTSFINIQWVRVRGESHDLRNFYN